jgi:hemerythrin
MTYLSWRRDYEVGVAQIDAEHHGLFDLINEFHETRARSDSPRESAKVLNRLIAYAEVHFQHEEKLMSDNNYPRLDMHRELHNDLVASIFAINERLAKDSERAGTEVLTFIRIWLVEHIIKNDIDVGSYLQRKASQAKDAPGADSDGAGSPETAREPVES